MKKNNVTVVINNRDIFTWLVRMVEHIEKFDNLEEIVIVDNGSTYGPLLEWYKITSHRVLFQKNLGHYAPWTPVVNEQINTDYYVVTDPDLDLNGVPSNTLVYLTDLLNKYPICGKIGLGLDIKTIPQSSPYFYHCQTYEKQFWDLPLIDNVIRMAPIDTTFAIYSKKLMNKYLVIGGRTDYPYVAKHLPWHLVELSDEYRYYLKNANSESSSFKKIVHINE